MEGEDHGHNSEIEMLESYSQSASNEALLVRATVDGEEEMVLIFKVDIHDIASLQCIGICMPDSSF